ncbi:MAG: hypothetical protein Q9218_003573 [Villophora microphyllina]
MSLRTSSVGNRVLCEVENLVDTFFSLAEWRPWLLLVDRSDIRERATGIFRAEYNTDPKQCFMDQTGTRSIPYIAKALLSNRNLLNINLKAIVLGDPTIGNAAAMTDVVTSTYLHQENVLEIFNLQKPILDAFKAADHACGFDKVMSQITYPPKGAIRIPGDPEGLNYLRARHSDEIGKRQNPCFGQLPDTPALINASISAPCSGGCATYSTALNYLPSRRQCFDPYNIDLSCDTKIDTSGSTSWLNQASVRAAIHAPNKTFQECNDTNFGVQAMESVIPPAYQILPELLAEGVKVHVYSGDLDFLLNHFGVELVLQNMTWWVCLSFRRPSLPGSSTFLPS